MPRRQERPNYHQRYPMIELYSNGQLIDYTLHFRRCDDALAFYRASYPWENFDEAFFADTGMGDRPRLRNKPNYKQREALETLVKELNNAK